MFAFDKIYDQTIDSMELMTRSELEVASILHYCYVSPDTERMILCCDDARFMNFAPVGEKPSLILATTTHHRERDLVAARDLAVGEELTVGPETDKDYLRKMTFDK